MRLIDADALEPSEVYMNYGLTRIVYMDDIDNMPTVELSDECIQKIAERVVELIKDV